MTDQNDNFDWDSVNLDETATDAEIKGSENLDVSNPVGKFLCTVIEGNPFMKTTKEYSSYAVKYKFRIDDVLEVEQPLMNEDGQPVTRDGEQAFAVKAVTKTQKAEANALYSGMNIFDEVRLGHESEKPGTKKRRLFVAGKLDIFGVNGSLTAQSWQGAIGKQVIIMTEWNRWKDSNTGEAKKNVKVAWSGYEKAGEQAETDFSNI